VDADRNARRDRCTRRERRVTWSARGPQGATGVQGVIGERGPEGPPGSTGQAGAPGSARAYGAVSFSGALSRAHNVDAVTNPSDGAYCIRLEPGIDMAATVPIVTLSASGGTDFPAPPTDNDDQGIVEALPNVNSVCNGLPGTDFQVQTGVQFFEGGALDGNTLGDQPFFFVVP
jgi:hypothetical protein